MSKKPKTSPKRPYVPLPYSNSPRDRMLADLKKHGCVVRDDFAYRTDDALERAYQAWVKAGSPAGELGMENAKDKKSGQVVERIIIAPATGKKPVAPPKKARR